MTSFTQVFGGTTIYPSQASYVLYELDADLTLEWPLDAATGASIVAQIVDIETDGPHTLTMPDAREASNGQTVLFNNLGPGLVTIVTATGSTLLSLSPGEVWQAYLTDNSTEAGSWRVFQYGASTAQAQASVLAGDGMVAIGSVLAQATDVSTINTTPFTLLSTDRASAFVWIGGLGTLNLPAAADVGNNWFVNVRNGGTGNWTIDPSGSEIINGASTLTLSPGDSAVLVTNGNDWWTIGLGKQAIFTFDYTSIDLSGLSGNYTLAGAELNRIAYNFTGAPTGNVTVIVPPTTQQYWITNSTSGGFTLALKVSGSSGSLNIAAGDKSIYYSNGTDLVMAVTTSGIPTPIAISDGGTNATSAANARANLGAASAGSNADVTRLSGLSDGSPSGAAVSFGGSGNTGLYRPGVDQIALAISGHRSLWIQDSYNNNDVVAIGSAGVLGVAAASTANTAIGAQVLRAATGSQNTGIGAGTFFALSSGSQNTAVGAAAAISMTTGSNNTMIGYNAAPSSNTVSNTVTLGNVAINTLRCQVTTITSLSDERDKTAVRPLQAGLDFVNATRPVEFIWNMRDGGKVGEADIGFLAQELLEAQDSTGHVIPHLVDQTNPEKLEAGYGMLIPVHTRAIQQLSDMLDCVIARLDKLEASLG